MLEFDSTGVEDGGDADVECDEEGDGVRSISSLSDLLIELFRRVCFIGSAGLMDAAKGGHVAPPVRSGLPSVKLAGDGDGDGDGEGELANTFATLGDGLANAATLATAADVNGENTGGDE